MMQTDFSHLPMSAQKLIAVIGLPATLRLVDACGGNSVNLYHSERSLERMAEVVGRAAAEKLLKFYGNAPFTVPLCHSALRHVRNREVLAEFDKLTMQEGMSARMAVAQITRRFTPYIHERTIWRILKTTGEVKQADPRQMSLI
ncbi:hypothetical protein H3H36_10830 [Duganella sp. FT3S]|uniref:Mor transcription activator family protein n=1 Tax=Rugamonas fusca TaxID=2758568 RepID=A0A7W2I6X2_9BURK|nr:Mor transcription activator family protein [Rugamonas fusca]MBA5605854.1 hypothetical protein [Rugamonas fusca]